MKNELWNFMLSGAFYWQTIVKGLMNNGSLHTSFGVDLSKSVVTQFVHQTVEHGWTSLGVNPEKKRRSTVV
jgi:hypothetical protein